MYVILLVNSRDFRYHFGKLKVAQLAEVFITRTFSGGEIYAST